MHLHPISALATCLAAGCGSPLPVNIGEDGGPPTDARIAALDFSVSDGSAAADAVSADGSGVPLDAAGARDAPVTDGAAINADAGTFACGPMVSCKLRTEFCFASNYGDAGMSGWMCDSLQNCAMGDRCMCLLLQHQCLAGCRDEGGPIFFWCPR